MLKFSSRTPKASRGSADDQAQNFNARSQLPARKRLDRNIVSRSSHSKPGPEAERAASEASRPRSQHAKADKTAETRDCRGQYAQNNSTGHDFSEDNVNGQILQDDNANSNDANEIIRRLQKDLSDAAEKNEILEQELLRLQEHQFQKMADPRFAPIEDPFVRQELSELRAAITKIGKKFANAKMQTLETRTPADFDELCRQLSSVVQLEEKSSFSAREQFRRELTNARMCFTALLSWHVHHEACANPFFFLKEDTNGTDWSSVFLCADQIAREVDADRVNLWRSQTLRYFMPRETTERALKMQTCTASLRRAASAAAAVLFLKSPSALLLRSLSLEECTALEKDVTAVFDRAAALSMLLWSQSVVLEVSSATELATARFKVDSAEMEAHPLHVLDDDADRRLDGLPIRIMVHPKMTGLRVCGTAEASTSPSVFAKATVYMGET